MCKRLKKECVQMCKKTPIAILQEISSDSLATFRLDRLHTQMLLHAPLFCKGSAMKAGWLASIALYGFNHCQSAIQHIIGQALDHGGATDETLRLLNHLGVSVSPQAMAKKRAELKDRQKKKIQSIALEEVTHLNMQHKQGELLEITSSYDILGDNIDITRMPSRMTKEVRTKSWHWFLLVASKKRVTFPTLDITPPKSDNTETENRKFIPSLNECNTLDEHFCFHIMKVLVAELDCFNKYASCLPEYLPHPYIQETSKATEYVILDLLDKSENKSDDMICILEHIHERYIPHSEDNHPNVIQRKVFGGDVLTNERAYTSQLAMFNGKTDFERLTGVIHRPEGLHRMMNLLLVYG